ncbi:aarF domain-containing kinase 1 [Plodia interpunctella]|uniref:aarF domain-containing kinase 1 n=1 Tax=Plodia interpunctella TaxID=58824 RepID=UPI0023688CD1|nr:aarF domain-containing kinase 1 [Plodia interpunctella]
MFSRNIGRLMKYGLYGSVGIGGTVGLLKAQEDDIAAITVVRIIRTAKTALEIGRIYKTMLYSKEWDTNSEEYQEIRSLAHQFSAEKLLDLCIANRGIYIKLGQHVGALEYLVPNEYVQTMQILHKNAPKNSVEELYKVIEEEYHKQPDELFDDFEPEPLGTASLAQVHKAKLKDGTVVAVKVQHSFVKNNFDMDLKWIEFVLKTMMKIFPEFKMQWLIDETKKNIVKELDFLLEGENADKVAKLFKHYKWLKIPKIYKEFSTSRVLVMEYINGGMVNDINYIKEHKINQFDLCEKIGDLYSNMIFVTGFVHSDPHPGNIMVIKEPGDKEVTLCLLDHGLYAQLTDDFKYHYSKLWLGILSRNTEQMRIHSEAMGIRKELYGLFACIVTGRTWEAIMQGIDRTNPSAREKRIFQDHLPSFIHQVTQCLEHVDRQALLVFKTNDLIRSIEYALGTDKRMCGSIVMTKYCLHTVYNYDSRHTSRALQPLVTAKYGWSLLALYLFSIYLRLIETWRKCCL